MGLAGISVAQLESALGPANDCFDDKEMWPQKDPKMKACSRPGWSFYYFPKGSGFGGGHNLVCWAKNGKTCLTLVWIVTA